ncbi:MAG: hypothetical protein IJY71_00720 [Clostridia bacterium]|nr:hypothetical protein [Clostridia bacterium]
MKRIFVSDMTLQSGKSLSFKEKIEIVRHLDKLNVDVIHMPAIVNATADALLIRTVSAFVKNSALSVPAGFTEESVRAAYAAVSAAHKPRLSFFMPVSAVQMEYSLHKKAAKMKELAAALFAQAVGYGVEVELVAEDATRADKDFLQQMILLAVEKGVSVITLCDDEGARLPNEFGAFVSEACALVPKDAAVRVGVLCRNTVGLATASVVTAMQAGAEEIKCCVGEADLPDITTFAGVLAACGDRCGFSSAISYHELQRITKQIKWICGEEGAGAVKGSVAEEAPAVYDKNDSFEAISDAVVKLGYDLSEEDMKRVYEEFGRVAEKKAVTGKDLEAVIASVAMQVPETYRLISYVVNNGNIIASSAQIKLEKEGKEIAGIAMGDGPIDAAFRTLEQIIGYHYELDDFQIQSVTEGREAVGAALVKLREGGRLYSGKGISTDIIGASIRAYISAVNKIVYEEANK